MHPRITETELRGIEAEGLLHVPLTRIIYEIQSCWKERQELITALENCRNTLNHEMVRKHFGRIE